jgi:choline kinase
MVKTDFSGISIDTPEDLIRAEEYLKRQWKKL